MSSEDKSIDVSLVNGPVNYEAPPFYRLHLLPVSRTADDRCGCVGKEEGRMRSLEVCSMSVRGVSIEIPSGTRHEESASHGILKLLSA